MSEAAAVEIEAPEVVDPSMDQVMTGEEVKPAESAPAEPVETEAAPKEEAEDHGQERVNSRINELTRKRYDAERRVTALEEENTRLRGQSTPTPDAAPPKLEDFDYDEDAHRAASIQFEVGKQFEVQQKQQVAQQNADNQAQRQGRLASDFMTREGAFMANTADYAAVTGNIPQLPQQTLEAIQSQENGPQIAYALGQNLEVAYEIANADPMTAAIRIGQISATLSKPAPVQTTTAPAPIDTVTTGGSTGKDMGDMSMDEIMAL